MVQYLAGSCINLLYLEALRPEVGISPGAKDLASSSDVELKKELYRAVSALETVTVGVMMQ